MFHQMFILQPNPNGLATAIRDFVAPLFLLAISLAALGHLYRRQVTQFVQFIAVAIGIAVLFYTPGVVQSMATLVSNALG